MSAHGVGSISASVRAARIGPEAPSLFQEDEQEPAPIDGKAKALLKSLRAEAAAPLLRKAAPERKKAVKAGAGAHAAVERVQVQTAGAVAAKRFKSKAERRKAKKLARTPEAEQPTAQPTETKKRKIKASLLGASASGLGVKRKARQVATEEEEEAPQPKRRAEPAATAKKGRSRPETSASTAAEDDSLASFAALATAASPAFTPGCVVRIVQPRGAKGPDGKYPRGHVAALKERLGGAGAVQFLRIVPDSPLVYVHFESAAGAARALSAGGVGQLSLLAGDEEASYWQERQLEQQQRDEAKQQAAAAKEGAKAKAKGGGGGAGKGGKGGGKGGKGGKGGGKGGGGKGRGKGGGGEGTSGSGRHRGTITF